VGDLLKGVTDFIGARFAATAFFPSLLFSSLLLLVVVADKGEIATAIVTWDKQDTTTKLLELAAFLSLVMFISSLVESMTLTLLQFYEGYWAFPGGRTLRRWGAGWHKNYLEGLRKASDKGNNAADDKIYLYYPTPSDVPYTVMPTRLGNILLNSELYAQERYFINSVLVWPRLYYLFPDPFVQAVAQSKARLDFMLVVTSLSWAFSIISGIYLFAVGAHWSLFLGCFWGGSVIAWLAYRGALGCATLYAQHIKVGFDLYRMQLLNQMRIKMLPTTLRGERSTWPKVSALYFGAIDPEWEYEHPKPTDNKTGE
jgi:hypothetical protein